ncbi:MAG: type I-C CRISPR-associated protein Cas8c/Csd1, partial [Candidatus Binatia bacterium]
MLDLVLKQAGESEPGFARKTVKWAITCTGDGRFTGVVSLGEGKGRTFDSSPNLSQPELVGGGEPRAHFLAEGLSTVALYLDGKTEEKDREKFAAKHGYFVNLFGSAGSEAPYLSAAFTLLTDTDALEAIRAELTRLKAKPTESATVIVDGINPLERDEWRAWWRRFRLTVRAPKTNLVKMRCLVTGDFMEPAAIHPKIKGLAGVEGLPTGDVMVG